MVAGVSDIGIGGIAEALAPRRDSPVTGQGPVGSSFKVAGFTRGRRGRKPPEATLAHEIVRHGLPPTERHCSRDGATFVEIGVEVGEQLGVISQPVRLMQPQRVK